MKTLPDSLCGQLLIAMPSMADPRFERAVTLICQHDTEGAVGLLINQPSEYQLNDVLTQLQIPHARAEANSAVPVLTGGPVQPDRGFVLHPVDGDWESSYRINRHWAITTSRDVLAAIASDEGPPRAIMMLGYAGWGPGQLEQELLDNAWLTASATEQILFETSMEQRWQAATASLGIEPHQLLYRAGHA